MNITNHIKEIKYRLFYLSMSFMVSLGICLEFKDTILFINFWYFFSDTPIYYSGIFEYYLIILELCIFFTLPFIAISIIFNIYTFLKPNYCVFELNRIRIKFLFFITISILSIIFFYSFFFPLLYKDLGIINTNIEFIPNITLVLRLQNSIILTFHFISILILLFWDDLFYFPTETFYKNDKRFPS